MALFVLGDTHLSLGGSKPMDVFPGWNNYVERLEANWRLSLIHISEPTRRTPISYAVFCLKKKTHI